MQYFAAFLSLWKSNTFRIVSSDIAYYRICQHLQKSLRQELIQKVMLINDGSSKKMISPHIVQTKRHTQNTQHFINAVCCRQFKRQIIIYICIRDSVCTEWAGYNATRRESVKELWPNKNILNSTTPGSIWFLFIPSLTPFPPVKLALNTSAR